jgi:hypothetical protein
MQSPRCQPCIDQTVMWIGGQARGIGDRWARWVAAKVGTERDWPAYEGKCADIARRKVASLSQDEGVLEALARRCHAQAAWRWGQIRATGADRGR